MLKALYVYFYIYIKYMWESIILKIAAHRKKIYMYIKIDKENGFDSWFFTTIKKKN